MSFFYKNTKGSLVVCALLVTAVGLTLISLSCALLKIHERRVLKSIQKKQAQAQALLGAKIALAHLQHFSGPDKSYSSLFHFPNDTKLHFTGIKDAEGQITSFLNSSFFNSNKDPNQLIPSQLISPKINSPFSESWIQLASNDTAFSYDIQDESLLSWEAGGNATSLSKGLLVDITQAQLQENFKEFLSNSEDRPLIPETLQSSPADSIPSSKKIHQLFTSIFSGTKNLLSPLPPLTPQPYRFDNPNSLFECQQIGLGPILKELSVEIKLSLLRIKTPSLIKKADQFSITPEIIVHAELWNPYNYPLASKRYKLEYWWQMNEGPKISFHGNRLSYSINLSSPSKNHPISFEFESDFPEKTSKTFPREIFTLKKITSSFPGDIETDLTSSLPLEIKLEFPQESFCQIQLLPDSASNSSKFYFLWHFPLDKNEISKTINSFNGELTIAHFHHQWKPDLDFRFWDLRTPYLLLINPEPSSEDKEEEETPSWMEKKPIVKKDSPTLDGSSFYHPFVIPPEPDYPLQTTLIANQPTKIPEFSSKLLLDCESLCDLNAIPLGLPANISSWPIGNAFEAEKSTPIDKNSQNLHQKLNKSLWDRFYIVPTSLKKDHYEVIFSTDSKFWNANHGNLENSSSISASTHWISSAFNFHNPSPIGWANFLKTASKLEASQCKMMAQALVQQDSSGYSSLANWILGKENLNFPQDTKTTTPPLQFAIDKADLSLKQSELLEQLMPLIRPRSDTFRIFVQGKVFSETEEPAVQNCELLVQRFPDFIDPTNPPTDSYSHLSKTNQRLGRRFRVIGFRWIRDGEF